MDIVRLLILVAITMVCSAVETSSSSIKAHNADHLAVATFYTNYSQRSYCKRTAFPMDGLFAVASSGALPWKNKHRAACGRKVRLSCVGKGCISNSVVTSSPPPTPIRGRSTKIVPGSNAGGPVVVTIVDICSSSLSTCSWNRAAHRKADIALSLTAFAQLADPDVGYIRVRYDWI
ncbi:hypothetical protein KP509_21G070300 [Ceratopteris richardii]|uniref:RlpA-like protein double-psi beta-barrel domain-containing protein n=1 Tax=Ceratopteris richardii TaxID=49495 RepID=A0A8T2SCN0_CERRI|nr:hypothetical protein KP509_21G070300 [Ceratopteris richardii]